MGITIDFRKNSNNGVNQAHRINVTTQVVVPGKNKVDICRIFKFRWWVRQTHIKKKCFSSPDARTKLNLWKEWLKKQNNKALKIQQMINQTDASNSYAKVGGSLSDYKGVTAQRQWSILEQSKHINPIQDVPFRDCSRVGGAKKTPSLKSVTHILQ